MTLTGPIKKLVILSRYIAKGVFDFKATHYIKSADEVGSLAFAFDNMVTGLQERDKVKNLFGKLHGDSVAEEMLSGEASVGGTEKQVAVFFSDIRSFTKFSESRTPEQIVAMLNEYFEVMVGVIYKHGGIVDKFIGDAIMAIWGAPKSTGNDPLSAVNASIEMRIELDKLNTKRIARGEPAIMIGMGLHYGSAISGTIGSEDRMEFTVIGDAVNMAARIEASTKAFGTDLLLSEDIANAVKDHFILEATSKVEVKGKSEPLTIYKCNGYKTPNGDKIIETPYSSYEASGADKVKITEE
jgi:adenylate cyclase